jgi:hypothetical protein
VTDVDGQTAVILRRLDALEAAIKQRAAWQEIEFSYDQARSAVERALGTRGRAYDAARDASTP